LPATRAEDEARRGQQVDTSAAMEAKDEEKTKMRH
jgi:hypothetical protein